MKLYLNAQRIGNNIFERTVDMTTGEETIQKHKFKPTLFKHTESETKYKDIYGAYCTPVKHDSMSDARKWMESMKDVGLAALGQENFALQYLSDTYPGELSYDKRKVRFCNVDIEVTAPEFPDPIAAKYEIDALTHYDSVEDKLFVFDLLNSQSAKVSVWDPIIAGKPEAEGGDGVPQEVLDRVVYMSFETERELLLEYINLWSCNYPAAITGWNTNAFDIPYIINRIKTVLGEHAIDRLSPYGVVQGRVIKDPIYGDKQSYSIAGVSSLDYLELYKKFSFTNQPSYKLDYVAEAETGVGKLEYDGPIHKLREENHQRYISYNIVDVWSVNQIDAVRGFLELTLSMSYYAKINYEDVLTPIKTWDAILFNSLRTRDIVIPEKRHHLKQKFPGAYVKEPTIVPRKYVISIDATSLYPSALWQCNISPETIVGRFDPAPLEDYINERAERPSDLYSCTPNGMMYRKDIKGILPTEVEKMFKQRKDWKKKMLTAERNLELIKHEMARRL